MLDIGEVAFSRGKHPFELWVGSKEFHHRHRHLVLLSISFHIDVLGRFSHQFAIHHVERDVGSQFEFVLILGDEHPVVQFAPFELGMCMSADDEVEIGEFLSQCHIILKSHM